MAGDLGQFAADQIVGGAKDLLEQAAAVATGGQADYIKSGAPQSVYGQMQQGIARQACRRYADDPSKFQGRASVLVENACRPYLDDIGYGDPPKVEIPFRGGQCATTYLVYATDNGNDLNIGGQTPLQLQGPLGSPTLITQFVGSPFSDSTRYIYRFGGDPSKQVSYVGRSSFARPGYRVAGRVDGQPDDCGSLPPVVTDPIPPITPGPGTEPFTVAPGVNIDIGVEVNPDGSITVDIGTGDITIDPFGEPEATGSGTAPSEEPSPGTEQEGTGSESGGGDTDFGDPPEGERWVGACMTLTTIPQGTGVIPPSLPESIFQETVGNARLKFASGSTSSYDTPVLIRSKTVCLWEPARGLNPTGMRVNLKPGFGYVIRPYSVKLEQ